MTRPLVVLAYLSVGTVVLVSLPNQARHIPKQCTD